MMYKPEIKQDLLAITIIIVIFAASLVALKMYDAKTNEVAKIGKFLFETYIK